MTNKINVAEGYITVDVIVFKEDSMHIAYIPALNLTSHSKEKQVAIKQVDEAVKLFFNYWQKSGKLEEKLTDLGWKKEKQTSRLQPSNENFDIPYSLLGKSYKRQPLKVPAYC